MDQEEFDRLAAQGEEFLEHFGVKGMHWGVRNAESQARRDANEHTKAQLFYGEGAGNRRKLIKAKVAERSKNPAYKKAFDAAKADQNLARRASQATRTRRRKDVKKSIGKNARGVHRSLTGGFGSVGLTAAAIAAGATYVHSTGADKIALKKVSDFAANQGAKKAAKLWIQTAAKNL